MQGNGKWQCNDNAAHRYTYGTHIVQKLTSCLFVYQCVYTCRCVSVNGNTNPIGFCSSFYSSKDGYVNGSEISGLQTALQTINNMFQDDIDNPCVPLMLQYLCHYYFPVCKLTTGEIIPVCRNSCALLENNKNCSELRKIANSELEVKNIVLPSDSCLQTYHSYANYSVLSEDCLLIEGQFAVLATILYIGYLCVK